jgi:hypothetical protein
MSRPLEPPDVVGALVVDVALASLVGVGFTTGEALAVTLVVIGVVAILGPRTFRRVVELRTND